MAFRYWSFTEAHPAHMVLSPQSRNEALEVLTWAYTDRILPSQKPVPPPFGPSECDELRKLINSFPADSPDDNGIQTRVVARVLLRVASWRQAHFRSHKPLPKDVKPVPPTSLAGRRASAVGKSVLRLVWDLFVVLVCLGLPYIFVEKRNRDEEGWHGELRTEGSGGSIFAVGVISCLVSAVILSASVTFLTLPGMTGAARIAGFVAISCAVGSMLASTIAFIRFRNEFSGVVDRTSINHRIVGGEGLVGISNRAVVNSLPLVFVAYSVIGFVVGLTIYSFRGTDLDGPSSSSPADTGLSAWVFGQGAKWSALGLLGAAGGVVAMSWVVWKQ
ncbi:hypothetical protein FA13DRAFT_1757693 [Coprinellus micaceus]|uniref:Uncharacterized protein n=1 Tax=Coprinellus micaceus TaxID=71717 RepID=A0A4Y7SH07_COPMI|nr:hypothetical protein FA13DRAFT_1757693 [Coprinellus micaceus]